MHYILIFGLIILAVIFKAVIDMFNLAASSAAGSPIVFLSLVVFIFIIALYFLTRKVRLIYEDREFELFEKQEEYKKRRDDFLATLEQRKINLDTEVNEKVNKGIEKEKNNIRDRERKLDGRISNLNSEVATKVNNQVAIREQKLIEHQEILDIAKSSAQKRIQKLVDASYKFKVKTLLAGVSLKNQHTKHEQMLKEKELYQQIRINVEEFGLEDNSDWDAVKKQFYEKLQLLERAQMEKDIQTELKRQMREEKQREQELQQRQKEAEEEEKRLEEQRTAIAKALEAAEGSYKAELEKQREELEQKITEVHLQYERAKSMAQLTKQGHVYVISNIGSFGNNVFKVGMTRRLEPMDRVKELGDASVPFEFDVHAMISCNDAPALEKVLHENLQRYQVNKVNPRKEFFRVDLEEVINLVEQHHGKVEYIADPIALQYYQTLEMES
ncbi:GIY-YIG nuclease family protein [Aliivibrio logei]|uniref:GIY-YIG nuclease family protein n=1 Tax=Aliivibrio logei TaxID=688 RepID=UPI0005569F51|nr:GIY-YIG nuclease family protein [Aliivibrio logei]